MTGALTIPDYLAERGPVWGIEVEPRKPRSPNYPGLGLEDAIERARRLYDKASRHPYPVTSAAEVWGISPNSSALGVTVGALKQFGLIEDAGRGALRQVKLTGTALDILLREVDDGQRRRAVGEAALNPPLFYEVWNRYNQEVPPQKTLEMYLVREKGFTHPGAETFYKRFCETIDFAKKQGALLGETDDDRPGSSTCDGDDSQVPPARGYQSPESGVRHVSELIEVVLPLAPGRFAFLRGPFPLTEAEWNLMDNVLVAMKPALLASARREAGDTGVDEAPAPPD